MEHHVHVHVHVWLRLSLVYVWMCACEGSWNFVLQLWLQKFYSNTRFQIFNCKYFCRILWPMNWAMKFLQNLKTVNLIFLLQPIYNGFLSDSYWKIFLVILSCTSKNLVNFLARKHFGFKFRTSTLFTFARTHMSASPLPFFRACSPLVGQQGHRRHAGVRWFGQRGLGKPGRCAPLFPWNPISSSLPPSAAADLRFAAYGGPLLDSLRGEHLLPPLDWFRP